MVKSPIAATVEAKGCQGPCSTSGLCHLWVILENQGLSDAGECAIPQPRGQMKVSTHLDGPVQL